MNEIVKVFKDNPVRIIQKDDAPWFVAKDVCRVLEIKEPRRSVACLDADEKGVHTMTTLGGDQKITVINESGLYSLILRSRKPEARNFKRWITHEVLPSIRETGRYSAGAKNSTQKLVEQINSKLLAGETVSPDVLDYVARIAGKPVIDEKTVPDGKTAISPSPRESAVSSFRKPPLSRSAQITMVFRSLPGILEFLDCYKEWTPRTDFVNAFYQEYADFICGVDRSRWWDALQRLRPLERTYEHGIQFIRFR